MSHLDDGADVLVISRYYKPETVGPGPVCADLAEAIARNGAQVKVITARPHYPDNVVFAPYRDGTRDRQFINRVEISRIRIFARGRDNPFFRLLSEGSLLLRAGAALARDPARHAPVIISFCPSICAVLLSALLRGPDVRCVAIVQDIQSGLMAEEGHGLARRLAVRALRQIERSVLNRCDLIVVMSEGMRASLRDARVVAPIEVHPVWIDTEEIRPLPARPGPARTALYSGTFGRRQGLLQLVDLAQELCGRGSALRLRLCGRGSQESLIRREVENRGLRNVDIHGLIGPEGLAQGDIHLVPQDPSIADYAVPSKIYGIMAAGRPFVATARRDSALWRLREESGAFDCVPPNDASAFASAVMTLAADPERRTVLGQRGREYVTRHCAKENNLRRLIHTIAEDRPADEIRLR